MSVYWTPGVIHWGESRLTLGSILKLFLVVSRGSLPIVLVMFVKTPNFPKNLKILKIAYIFIKCSH